jgi:hypothetical protein
MHTDGKGCCHDEVKIIKLQDDHQTSSISFSLENFQPVIINLSEFLSLDFFKQNLSLNKTDHSPPLLSQQDVYLQNRVFRI